MNTASQNDATHTTSKFCVQDYIPDWANQFYQAKKVEGISAFTLTFYKQQLGHFLRYCEAQVITRVNEITPNIIRQFMLWHEETGHNPGGLHAAFRVLRTFLIWYDNEVEPDGWRNPIHKVKAPKLSQEPLEPADLDDVAALINVCRGSKFLDVRDKALLMFLLDTGARAREVSKIDMDDVDLVSGQVLIRQGKGRKPRLVFLGKTSRKALRTYVKARVDTSSALWVNSEGERLCYGGMRGVVVRRANQAGINAPSLHSFRRAFAINMLRAEVDLVTIARLLGHSSLKTLERYLKQLPDDLRVAHAKGSPVDRKMG